MKIEKIEKERVSPIAYVTSTGLLVVKAELPEYEAIAINSKSIAYCEYWEPDPEGIETYNLYPGDKITITF